MFKFIFLLISTFCFISATTIEGTVTYGGNLVTASPVSMDADPMCGIMYGDDNKPLSEKMLLNEKKQFQNVMVWLKPVNEYTGDLVSSPATIDQIGCRYTPHVNIFTVGQEVLIKNSDETLHNVNSKSKVNESFNSAQPAGVPEIKKEFNSAEEPFYLKCDVHPWMKAWIMVSDHPYFSITDENGFYKIENVPSGNYEIVFWQERLSNLPKKYIKVSNAQSLEIKDADETTVVDYEFQKPVKK